jgi:MFS family permease
MAIQEHAISKSYGRGPLSRYGKMLIGNNSLNLMFTTAAVATNVAALPIGTILDKYGPRVSGIIGSILLAIGSAFWIFGSRVPFDAYIPGYLFLALGGPFVFISSFQLSNTFPRHSGLILALLTGAFDSSSAVFLFYRLVYTATNGSFTPSKLFTVYLIVPVFILLAQIFLMPARSYKTVGELISAAEESAEEVLAPNSGYATPEDLEHLRVERRVRRESVLSELAPLIGKKGEDKQRRHEQRKIEVSGVWGALHGQSAFQQIKSPWFILITLFTVVQMTRINYFVATIRPQYEYMLGDLGLAEHVNNFFDIALPLGGIISIPFIGLILDNTSTTFVLSLLVTTASVIGILGVLPYLWAAYANITLFVLYRPLYYTAVSDYASKVFGYNTFGKVYGLIICLAGLLNFVQSALDALRYKQFKGDPVPVNLILLITVVVVGSVLVLYVFRKSKEIRQAFEEEGVFREEEDGRIRTISEVLNGHG